MRLPVYKVLSKGNTEEQLQIQVTPNHEYSVKSAYRFMKKYDLDYDFEQLLSIISREKLGRDIPISENVWDNLIVINGSYSVTKDGKTMEEIKPKKAADIYRRCSPGRLRQIEEYSKQMDDSWQKPIFIHSSVFNQFSFGINKNTTLILDGARRIVAGCLRGGSFKDAHILMTSEYFGSNIIDISDIDPSALAWFPNYQTITEIGLEGKRGNKRYEYFDLSQFKDKIVFDFGCNLGQACIKIAIAGAEHVFGFESQEDTLKAANKIVDRMGIENISYHQIDFNDRDFDRKIDAIVNSDADFSCFLSVYRTKELRQRERLFQYIIDKTKDKIFFEGHADPKIDTLEYYDGLFKRFGLEYEFKGYSEGWTRPFFICAKKSLSSVAQLGTAIRASPPVKQVTKRDLGRRKVLMTPSESIARRAVAFYRRHGFWAFVKAVSNYFLREWRFSPYAKGVVLHKGKADELKVLYVDTISASNAKSNVNGMMKAYSKVSTLMTFDYRKLARRYGQSRMNEILVEAAIKFKPDLIHLGKAELIYGLTIKRIKEELDTCVIHFYGDFRWEPQPWVVDIGKYADCTLFYHKETALIKQYEELGVRNTGFWWYGTDPDIFYPRKQDKIYDITLMGNNYSAVEWGECNPRLELVNAIVEKGFNLHIFGNGWEYLSHSPNVHIHPFVDMEKFAEACSAAKITLGIIALNNIRMLASWRRPFNSMASGAFHLIHYVPGMEEVFENRKHLVWFDTVPEAIQLIEYYLAHDEERERIAEAGRQEVLAHHIWDIRIAEILRIYQQYKPSSFDKGAANKVLNV